MDSRPLLLLAGAALAPASARGSGWSPALVLAGWQAAAEAAGRLPAYRLEGTSRARFPGVASLAERKTDWTSTVSGGRYRIRWQTSGEPPHEQSFDGKAWYLLSGDPEAPRGSIVTRPAESVEVDLDAHLREQTAGVLLPTVRDVVERPLNVAGKSLLAAFRARSAALRARRIGDDVELALSPEVAERDTLPRRIRFRLAGAYFVPASVEYETLAEGVRSRVKVDLAGWKTFGDLAVPTALTTTTFQGNGGRETVLAEEAASLSVRPVTNATLATFQIPFGKNAAVFDDRRPLAKRYGVPTQPEAKGTYRTVAFAGGMALAGVALLVVARRRRKA